jgi:hypothetical protein
MFTLSLTHPDGSIFIVGGFATSDAANAWIANAQKEPGWIPGTVSNLVQVQIAQPPSS